MKKLIILGGVMGVGKTHFAKNFVKINKNYTYFDYDCLFRKNDKDFSNTIKEFVKIINNLDRDVIVDGWFKSEHLVPIQNKKIEHWLIYAEPHVCLARFKKRTNKNDPNYTLPKLKDILKKVLNNKYDKTIVYNTEQSKELKEADFMKILNDSEAHNFERIVDHIKNNFGKNFYHGYKLPFNLKIDGLKTKDGEFITDYTIRNISEHVDFKGKTMLDLGCYSGYFCFKAKQLGARYVSGIDCYDKILAVARDLNEAFGKGVNFVKADIETATWGDYDITFLFSILHHTETPFHILKKTFKHSREYVVIELDLPRSKNEMEFSEKTRRSHDEGYLIRISVKSMNQFADGQGFDLLKQFPSAKFNREVLIYRRKQ